MSSMIDRIKSLRARALGLNGTNARFDEIQQQQEARDASLRADFASGTKDLLRQQADLLAKLEGLPIPALSADIEALKAHHAKMATSVADLAAWAAKATEEAESAAAAAAETAATAMTAITAMTEYHPGQAIRVAFLVQHSSIWPSWRSVYNAAGKDPRFSVCVVLTPFVHPFSSEAKAYEDMKQCLLSEGVPFCTADYFDPASSRPHVVFIQNPYEETRPAHLRIDRLSAAGCRITYIPYGLELGGGAWNIGAQFDTALHRSAWRVFVRSERSRTMFGRYCLSGNNHVVVTGHPKFDATNIPPETAPRKLLDHIAGRKVILWTPHFSVGTPPSWATFQTYGDYILSEMRRRPDLFLLMRPHPLFFKAMREHNAWDAGQEKAFRNELNATENFALDEAADYHTALSVADALMADVGSFLLEFLPTGKPLLYLHCEGGLGMNDDGEIIDALYAAYGLSDITSFIDMVARGEDPRKHIREAAVPDFLFGLDLNSTAGERICEHIHQALNAGTDWSRLPVRARESQPDQVLQLHSEQDDEILFGTAHQTRKMAALDSVLDTLPRFDNTLLVGTGVAELLKRLAENTERLSVNTADDASVEATQRAAAEGVPDNVRVLAQELPLLAPTEVFGLVCAIDATSTLADDVQFLQVIEKFRLMTRPGGLLLLIESLSTRHDRLHTTASNACRKFRSDEDFKALILRQGFASKAEVIISEADDEGLVSKLFVFELASGHRARHRGAC